MCWLCTLTAKFFSFLTPNLITFKLKTKWSHNRKRFSKVIDGMANNEDSDQTAPLKAELSNQGRGAPHCVCVWGGGGCDFCTCKNKDADQLRLMISAFVFATRLVQSLFFLYSKFQASSHIVWSCSLVCVGPGRKSRRPVFSQRGSYTSGI